MLSVQRDQGWRLQRPDDQQRPDRHRRAWKRPGVFIYQTDLAKAKELILAGGFAEGDTFEYMVASEEATERAIAELFQANIAEMGFKLDVTEFDSAAYNDMMYGDSPAEERPHFMGGWFWWPDYNDAWNQLYPNFAQASSGGGGAMPAIRQRPHRRDPHRDRHFTDENEYAHLMKEAQNILTEQDPPVLYYGEAFWTTVLRKDIVGFSGTRST